MKIGKTESTGRSLCAAIVLVVLMIALPSTYAQGAKRHFFLSEVGGCKSLPGFLQRATSGDYANATLIVDQRCELSRPLVVPKRFTLAGVGIAGGGELIFTNATPGMAAIRLQPTTDENDTSHVTIRDLSISGYSTTQKIGIDVSQSSIVFIKNVRVSNFGAGLSGHHAVFVQIDQSNFVGNGRNIEIGSETANWHVRDSIISHSPRYGIVVGRPTPSSTATSHSITGNAIYKNALMGVWVAGARGSVIADNRFFEHGYGGDIAINWSDETRVLYNYFDSAEFENVGTNTQCAHNIGLSDC